MIITYGGWSIRWQPEEQGGWIFNISFQPISRNGLLLEPLNVDVGFFRDLKEGEEVCKGIIDRCLEIQRQQIYTLLERHSRSHPDLFRANPKV